MCAIGGASLPQWMPDYAVNTAYGNMLAQARKARAKGTIKGFLWYQGESDCGDSNNVIAYSQRMHARRKVFCLRITFSEDIFTPVTNGRFRKSG